jgi:hypothetical protein
MRKYSRCVFLAVLLLAPAFAFADVATVNFDSLMDTASAFVYGGDHLYEYLDGNGYYKDAHNPADPHEWVPPCDNNSNGIPDVIEFAVLSAIFADVGNPLHAAVHEAWKANVARADTDLGFLARALTGPTYFLRQIMGAYATLGDGDYTAKSPSSDGIDSWYGSWGIFAKTISDFRAYGSGWNSGAPDEANYTRLDPWVSACGDADSDSVTNVNEFYGQGEDRALYVAAVLDAGITQDTSGPGSAECGGTPLPDVDADGLPDASEAGQGCNPLVADASLSATIDLPSNGALFHTTPIMLGGRTSSSYIDRVRISTDGGTVYSRGVAPSGMTWTYLWTPASAGTYAITILARNTFGGSTTAGPVTVVYHPDVPTAAITSPVDGTHVHGSVPMTGSVLAGLLGLQQYALDYHPGLDPEAPTGWVRFRTSSSEVDDGPLGTWNASGLADGPYVLRLRITDGTGDDLYYTHVIVYVDSDTIPPGAPSALNITSGVFPDVVSNGMPVTVRGTAGSQCYVASAEVLNESAQAIKDVTNDITLHLSGSVRGTFTLPDDMTATTVALRLRVKDAAGNISGAKTSNALPVDNAAPTVQVAFPVNGATLPRDLIIVSGVAADNGVAGLEKIEFSADGSTWSEATGTEAWSYHWTPPTEGPYTLHVRGTDKQGNSAEVAVSVTINSAYPSAYITSPAQGEEVDRGTTIEVVGTATDTSDFKNYRLEYAEGVSPDTYWTNLTADPITTPVTNGLLGTWSTAGLDQGTYTLRLIVRDNSYNAVIFDMQVFVRDLECEYMGLFNNELTEEPPGQGPMFAGLLPTMSQPISDLFYVIGYETWRDYDIEYLEEALNHTRERPGDGLPDRFQMALVEYSLCHPTSPHHEEAMAGFLANRAAFVSDIEDLQGSFPDLAQLLPLADLFAGMMGTSEVMHTTIDAIIRMLTDGSTGLPRLEEYVVFGTGEKAPNEPFSAEGDFDGDGISNITEYDDVMAAGGDVSVFLEAATDPSPFWPGNPALPVGSITAVLALLFGAALLGSCALLRRRE